MPIYVDVKGLDQVLANYDIRETPFFALYCGKDLKFFNSEDDIEAGKSVLNDNLTAIVESGNTAIYKLVFYKDADSAETQKKTGEKGCLTFRLNEVVTAGAYHRMNDGIGNVNSNKEILEELKQMNSRLNALEIDEDEEEEIQPQGMAGVLNGLVNNPQIQTVLVEKILGLIAGFSSNKNNPGISLPQPAATIGEVDEQAVLTNSLQILIKNGMTIADFAKLATIAETQNAQFNLYLSMLRQ